ncbi:MAG TPA: glycosyltransferase [Solirubrobacteraceae bacterium]|nr:glycosyltransferase [Solirubrobacteraceae bacterium]
MNVSVIVALDSGAERSLRCLAALASVPDDPPHEVVVVDDASGDLAPVLARIEGGARIVRLERRSGAAAALAAGGAQAAGDAVVLLRGPVEVEPAFLAPLVGALADPAVAAAVPACGGTPTSAPAVAVRRADLTAIGGVPAAPDALVTAELLCRLAGRGAVREVAASVVNGEAARTTGARRAPGEAVELSIVIPTLDAASDRVRACVAAIQRTTDAPHEIVIVDNGAPPQGFTAPVNAGLRAARGAYAVVMNDDVETLPGWWPPLRAGLDAGSAVTFPLTIDGAMRPDFAAWCFAVSRAALGEFEVEPGEFFDPGLVVWYQDTDLLQRLRLAGRPPRLIPESQIRHGLSLTVATDDPALRAWIDHRIALDRTAFEAKHGAGVPGAAR